MEVEIVNFQIFIFTHFGGFVFVNMGPYGSKSFDISSENTHDICSPKCMYILRGGGGVKYQTCYELCNLKF